MDTKLGEKYKNDICDECKKKVETETAKLSKWDLIRPGKLASKFASLLCKKCTLKLRRKLSR